MFKNKKKAAKKAVKHIRRRQVKGQLALIDTSHPGEKPIIAAALEYECLRDARMAAGKLELDARAKLIDVCEQNKLDHFDRDDLHVQIIDKKKVKVSRGSAADNAIEPYVG